MKEQPHLLRLLKKSKNLFSWQEAGNDQVRALFISLSLLLAENFSRLIYEDAFSVESKRFFFYLPAPIANWGLSALLFPSFKFSQLFCSTACILSIFSAWSFFIKRIFLGFVLIFFLFLIRIFLYLQNVLLWEVYDHLLLLFLFFVILFPYKIFQAKFALGLGYLLAFLPKLSPTWFQGELFRSVNQFHFFPFSINESLATYFALGLMTAEISTLAIFQIAPQRLARLASLGWIFFHIFTIYFLGYKFPVLMISLHLLIFFHPSPDRSNIRPKVTYFVGGLVLIFSLFHYFIPGPARITGEWRTAGLFMMDVNQRCKLSIKFKKQERAYFIDHEYGYTRGLRLENGQEYHPNQHKHLEIRIQNTQNGSEVYRQGLHGQAAYTFGPVFWAGEAFYNSKLIASTSSRIICSPYVIQKYATELQNSFQAANISIRLEMQFNGYPHWLRLIDIENFDHRLHSYSLWRHQPWINLADKSFPPIYWWP